MWCEWNKTHLQRLISFVWTNLNGITLSKIDQLQGPYHWLSTYQLTSNFLKNHSPIILLSFSLLFPLRLLFALKQTWTNSPKVTIHYLDLLIQHIWKKHLFINLHLSLTVHSSLRLQWDAKWEGKRYSCSKSLKYIFQIVMMLWGCLTLVSFLSDFRFSKLSEIIDDSLLSPSRWCYNTLSLLHLLRVFNLTLWMENATNVGYKS